MDLQAGIHEEEVNSRLLSNRNKVNKLICRIYISFIAMFHVMSPVDQRPFVCLNGVRIE